MISLIQPPPYFSLFLFPWPKCSLWSNCTLNKRPRPNSSPLMCWDYIMHSDRPYSLARPPGARRGADTGWCLLCLPLLWWLQLRSKCSVSFQVKPRAAGGLFSPFSILRLQSLQHLFHCYMDAWGSERERDWSPHKGTAHAIVRDHGTLSALIYLNGPAFRM